MFKSNNQFEDILSLTISHISYCVLYANMLIKSDRQLVRVEGKRERGHGSHVWHDMVHVKDTAKAGSNLVADAPDI